MRTGAVFVPVFMDGEKKLFHRTRIIIGEPYTPSVTGRHGTAEEMQAIADELLRRAYGAGRSAGGRQAVMQVILAESAGFCYGVKRAVELAQRTVRRRAAAGCWET